MTVAHEYAPAEEQPRPVRFTLAGYLRMAEDGHLLDERTEYIDGEILRMPPQKNSHIYAISMLVRALDRAVGDRHWVRGQAPLTVGDVAAPEPDVAVVAGPPRPGNDIPTAALFVAEVSDTTLRYDRETKLSLYAFAGVPEYWILNLVDRRIEVHHEPVEDKSAPFGWRMGGLRASGATRPLRCRNRCAYRGTA